MKSKAIRKNQIGLNGSKSEIIQIIPLLFIIMVIPIIVYLKVIPVTKEAVLFAGGENNSDFFSYYKMVWLLISTVIGVLMIVYYHIFDSKFHLKKSFVYKPIIIFILLAVISTVFSDYKSISLFGFVDRYEGLLVLIAYMTIIIVSMNLVKNEYQMKLIVYGLAISIIIISIIGVTQFIGKDFFMTDIGKAIILPAKYEHIADGLRFTFEDRRSIYATMYNTNYVGVYMSMTFALFSTLAIFIKSRSQKIFFSIIALITLIIILGSRSRAALFGIIFYIIALAILNWRQIIKHWKSISIGSTVVFLIILGINFMGDGFVFNRFKQAMSSITTTIKSDFEDIILVNNSAEIVFDTYSIGLLVDDDSIGFFDEKDNPLEMSFSENTFIAKKEPYSKHSFKLQKYKNDPVVSVNLNTTKGNKHFRLVLDKPNSIGILGYGNKVYTLIKAPSVGFEGRESLATNRGYIWSRTIPMLRDTIIVGSGPDTYALKFPNYDYVGKIIGLNDTNALVDKPHNMYLQTAVNTGVLSLIAQLAIFIGYLIQSFKLYHKKATFHNFTDILGLSIFLSVSVCLFTGITNDSVISVAPVFWVLLGLGYCVNDMVKAAEK